MIVKNPNNYVLVNFRKSKTKNKKYDAILRNKITYKLKYVPFGDVRYEQYHDQTPLKLYSYLDHGDKKRRDLYYERHSKDINNKFSSGYFSYHYLW